MSLEQDENLILQSYLNCLLITSLKNNNFFDSEYFEMLDMGSDEIKRKLKEIEIDNQGMLLSFFYSMLVLPQEKIFNDYESEFENLNEFIDVKKCDASSTYKKDKKRINTGKTIHYIKHIRNAVAHGNVRFEPNSYVEFHDECKDNNTKQIIAECYIKIKLQDVGSILEYTKNIFRKYIQDIINRSSLE